MTLQDLTRQESGVIVYENEGAATQILACNWTQANGFPRIDPMGVGIIGIGEELTVTDECQCADIGAELGGEVIWDRNNDYKGLAGYSGIKYIVSDGFTTATVYAPKDWN
jgi:hypothetical protein